MLMCRDVMHCLELVTRFTKHLDLSDSSSSVSWRDVTGAVLQSDQVVELSGAGKRKANDDLGPESCDFSETESPLSEGAANHGLQHRLSEVVVVANPVQQPTLEVVVVADHVQQPSLDEVVVVANPVQQPTLDKVVVADPCKRSAPPVRGRRLRPCRICGYGITARDAKLTDYVLFGCCGLSAHKSCWERVGDGAAVRCAAVSRLLCKDRRTPFEIRKCSKKRPASDVLPSSALVCRYCGVKLVPDSADDKRHILQFCGAIDRFTEPLSVDATSASTLAKRLAGVTKARKIMTKCPTENRQMPASRSDVDGLHDSVEKLPSYSECLMRTGVG